MAADGTGQDLTAAGGTGPARLVLADGDRVTAWGRLVTDERGTWFEPPLPETLAYFADPPVRPAWDGAVQVTGADHSAVASRREGDGRTEGWAALTGTWSAGRLTVTGQQPADADPADPDGQAGQFGAAVPDHRIPPGPPPQSGWPRGRPDANLAADLGDLRETGAAVTVTTFRPSRTQAVLVVAAADAAAVEARLRPQLGARLRVVPSRWTRRELDAVRGELERHWRGWRLFGLGEQATERGQACVVARLALVPPDLAAWAAGLPPDLLVLEPWLVPSPGQRQVTAPV